MGAMSDDTVQEARDKVDEIYRAESRQVLATLIRLLGDFDTAEEALHEAFTAAMEQWPRDGVPTNPRAWLVSTGRFKAIDGMRRRARYDASQPAIRWNRTMSPSKTIDYGSSLPVAILRFRRTHKSQ
jgi:predicted RNA polymerase sigma factor